MSEQKRSQDFHFEFEHHWGGERTQLQKIKGWIANRNHPSIQYSQHYSLG